MPESAASPTQRSRFIGCLLGGAAGDALGAPVEFLDFAEILRRFGPQGLRDFALSYGRIGAITDDTQMTLFTAEGLLRAQVRLAERGVCHVPSVVHRAYLRWLLTQGDATCEPGIAVTEDGWLVSNGELCSCRAPGSTCLSALRDTRELGRPATNNSKGCGGVMRMAPVGLAVKMSQTFDLGCELAALTHGHPSGYLSAGFLALVISHIVHGATLTDAITVAKLPLIEKPGHSEVLAAVNLAEREAKSGSSTRVSEGRLGGGWIAEEALSIALYSALVAQSFEEAVMISVNHSGDSDSTGAIAGNICGALYGVESIPERWLEPLEMRSAIEEVAIDLLAMANGTLDEKSERVLERYPAN